MGDKIPLVEEQVIKAEGLFNIQETYTALKNYVENDRHYDWAEKDITEKNNGTRVFFYSISQGDFPYTDYIRSIIQMKLTFEGEYVEIVENGKKKILTQGNCKMSIYAYGEADWMNKRKRGPGMTFLIKMVDKYYGKEGTKKMKDKTILDVDGLIKLFKQHVRASINAK